MVIGAGGHLRPRRGPGREGGGKPAPALVMLILAVLATAIAATVCVRLYVKPVPANEGSVSQESPGDSAPAQQATAGDAQAGAQARGSLPGASVVLEGTRIVVPSPSGAPEWEFSAGTIEIAEERRMARLADVEGARYVDGAAETRVRAQALTVDLASGRLEFEGVIEVSSKSGAVFSARRATWEPGASRFAASGDVTFSDGRSTMTGDALEADAALKEAVMKGSVRFSTVVSRG